MPDGRGDCFFALFVVGRGVFVTVDLLSVSDLQSSSSLDSYVNIISKISSKRPQKTYIIDSDSLFLATIIVRI